MDNVPSSNGYKGGFGTALMTKDLGLAQDAATRAQAATPLGSLAHQVNWRGLIFFLFSTAPGKVKEKVLNQGYQQA